jgi:hypothetical protein
MVPRSAFFAATLLLAAACGKGESTEPAVAAQDDRQEGQSGAVASATIDASMTTAAPETKPQGRTAPPGWKLYANHGYSIMAPPTPPNDTDFGDVSEAELAISGQDFRFADCFGQVIQLHYKGNDTFDVEKGLDRGIKQMLQNIGATTTESSSKLDEGRIARQYRVNGSWKGRALTGLGRGIAVDDKTVVVVNSFWQSTDKTCPELGEFFVDSFSVGAK